MNKDSEQYTEIEKEAQKWLDETDTMQFSTMELLTMFHAHQLVKNNGVLGDVSKCGFIDLLEREKESKCNCCGDIETAGWKECGCSTEGSNEGIDKAIKLFKSSFC